jgi:hypothetical protein
MLASMAPAKCSPIIALGFILVELEREQPYQRNTPI